MDGFCPESYIGMAASGRVQAAAAVAAASAAGPVVVRSSYPYTGQNPDDLSFDAGELFEVLTPDQGDGWVQVRRSTSTEVGFIPIAYVTPFDGVGPDATEDESYVGIGGDEYDESGYEGGEEASFAWFHENLSRQDAERMLADEGSKGYFLIRPSQKDPYDFSVSVHGGNDTVKHFKVKKNVANGNFEFGERVFDTLAELVKFYHIYSIYTTAEEEGICLEHALPARL
jgi:hypothetical protein